MPILSAHVCVLCKSQKNSVVVLVVMDFIYYYIKPEKHEESSHRYHSIHPQ
jgi:hypothetical protein